MKMRILLREALRYALASGIALVADISILWLLVHYFSRPYLVAATASFCMGLVVGYALAVSLVFTHRRLKNRSLELASFAAIGIVGLGMNAAAMLFRIRWLKLHYLLAKRGAAGFTFLWNFAARRQVLFVQRRTA